MVESKDEEEARKAVELARMIKGVAYLLITIYVLITCGLGFILGVNIVLFPAIAIILLILLTIPTTFILDRKISYLAFKNSIPGPRKRRLEEPCQNL